MRLTHLAMLCTAMACGDDNEPTTDATELCSHIFAVCSDGLGWSSEAVCAGSFLDDEASGTLCETTDAYLVCAAGCLSENTCGTFDLCETICWETHC